jgi:hypothetical protein
MRITEEIFDDDVDDETEEFSAPRAESNRLAYIKAIGVEEARAMGVTIPSGIELPSGIKLFALHAADGTTLGITDNWASAYSAAVQNNFLPVSVH